MCVCVCVCVSLSLSLSGWLCELVIAFFLMSFQTVIESYTFKFSYSTQCGVEIFRWVYGLIFHLLIVYWTKSLYWVGKTNCLCCTIYISQHSTQNIQKGKKSKGNPMTKETERERSGRNKPSHFCSSHFLLYVYTQ